jgi:hypothetical protein
VIDLETEYYVRFMVDQECFDISEYRAYVIDEVADPRLEFTAYNTGRLGENDIMIVDEFIVTTDEIK